MTWSRRFDDPIELSDGRILRTLREAADHIQRLPQREQDLAHWQTAIEHLIRGAEGASFWMMPARVAFLQALHHGMVEPPSAPRRKAVKAYRIVR